MFTTGLVSVSFRELSAQEIISQVDKAKLDGIEWGGDVHVPHGDTSRAKEVAVMTQDAGLTVPAYGSYHRIIDGPRENPEWAKVVETAKALGAPTIRVWAGQKPSTDCDPDERRLIAETLHNMANLAAQAGVRIALEYHGGTLTDDHAAASDLIHAAHHDNIDSLWQPPNGWSTDDALYGLNLMLPHVSNIHVFHWKKTDQGQIVRLPLAEGEERWTYYLEVFRSTNKSRALLLEFFENDSPDQMLADAATLRKWIEALHVL